MSLYIGILIVFSGVGALVYILNRQSKEDNF